MNGELGGWLNNLNGPLGSAIPSPLGSLNTVSVALTSANLIDDLGDALLTSDGDNLVFAE